MKHTKSKLTVLIMTAVAMAPTVVFSEILHRQFGPADYAVNVSNDPYQPEGFEPGIVVPSSYVAIPDITVDGRDDEPQWGLAIEVDVPMRYGDLEQVSLKSLYTDKEVFIRVRWKDDTENREHHPWVWDTSLERYVEGPQVEDSVFLSFEAGCEWFPSLLDGYMYDYDGWQWLAARSDPLGQAVDIGGTVQDQNFPALNFVEYKSRSTEDLWNMKFPPLGEDELHANWDELDRVYYLQPYNELVYVRNDPDGFPYHIPQFVEQIPAPVAPPADETERYPRYQPMKLEGEAGEVAAKGQWEDGYWTVEFRRDRVTPARTKNDVVLTRLTQFAVHVYDQAERLDQASETGRLYLRFVPTDVILVGD